MRLMIVDDDRQIREGIRYGIDWEAIGIDQVKEYANGKAAMGEFEEFQPDIILADIRMPQMDGLEFLQEVRQRNEEVRFLILSAYSDFEYAREAIRYGANDYELKPIKMERLIQMVKENAEELTRLRAKAENPGESLIRILEGEDGEADPAELVISLLGRDNMERSARLLAVKLHAESGLEWRDDNRSEALKEMEAMARYFDGILLPVKLDDRGEIFLCLCRSSVSVLQMYQQKIEIKNQLEGINDRMRERNISVTAGVSGHHSCASVLSAWQEAGKALNECFYLGRGSVSFWNGNIPSSKWEKDQAERIRKEFLRAAETLSEETLQEALDQLMKYIADARPKTDQLREFLMRTAHDITQNMEQYLSTEKMRNTWENARFVQEYIEAFREYFLEVMRQKAKQRRLDRFSASVASAVRYLEIHFMEPVTIEKVAESLGKSANYLSSLFKRETGSSFTDYLLRLRMEEACRLLQNTGMPIKKVGEQVGYSDYVYFSKLFKKTFGCSASDYRRERKEIRRVILPLIKPSIKMVFSMMVMWAFKTYDIVATMTGGGPGDLSKTAPIRIIEQAFTYNKFGYASALSLVFAVLIIALILLVRKCLGGEAYEY